MLAYFLFCQWIWSIFTHNVAVRSRLRWRMEVENGGWPCVSEHKYAHTHPSSLNYSTFHQNFPSILP